MTTYQLSIFKASSIRLSKVEGRRRTKLAEAHGRKAELAQRILLLGLPLTEKRRYRHGLVMLEADEETALRIIVGLKALTLLRNLNNVQKILETVKSMDRGEVYWWHSLLLRLGYKAMQALRTAYL